MDNIENEIETEIEIDQSKRDLIKKSWKIPTLMILGAMVTTPVLGGSSVCSSPPCSHSCGPARCKGCPQCQ